MIHQFHDETEQYIHQLLRVPTDTPEPEQYWFPTPEQPGDAEKNTPIKKRIYNELLELQKLEALNPQHDKECEIKFLANFDWKDSTLSLQERHQI